MVSRSLSSMTMSGKSVEILILRSDGECDASAGASIAELGDDRFLCRSVSDCKSPGFADAAATDTADCRICTSMVLASSSRLFCWSTLADSRVNSEP